MLVRPIITQTTKMVESRGKKSKRMYWAKGEHKNMIYSQVIGDVVLAAKVRKTPSWPRSWANFNFLSLYPRRNAWANLHLLGQPNTFLAAARASPRWTAWRRASRRCSG
jgi:hypothetical protein